MTEKHLRAVVIGAGGAGQGHTVALRHSGVEVAAICARDEAVVRAVAASLGVPQASTDWRRTLETLKPDIVAIATPAGLRAEPIEVACALGSHVLCEKPLAATAAEARKLVGLVDRAGVKHAFGTTWGYSPAAIWLSELLREGVVGRLYEVGLSHRPTQSPPELTPWSWFDSLALGGGVLNNCVVHHLAQLERMVGGQIVRVVGTGHPGRDRAPYVPGIHDFRQLFASVPSPEAAARGEWRESDADMDCRALLQIGDPVSGQENVEVVLVDTMLADAAPAEASWRFYGDRGTLVALGGPFMATLREVWLYREAGAAPEVLPVPERLVDDLPKVGPPVLSMWAALVRDLVADVRGEAHQPYPTLRDGWRYQEAIDAIRDGRGWYELPTG